MTMSETAGGIVVTRKFTQRDTRDSAEHFIALKEELDSLKSQFTTSSSLPRRYRLQYSII